MIRRAMRILVGTSGFSFPEWKGAFYPDGMADADLLRFYADQLGAVEINNTFYRMPKSSVMTKWASDVPDGFRFAIKASRRITHHAKLADCGELLGYLWGSIQKLGDRLGPVLFQLPPYLREDVALLRAFLAELPAGLRAAFEFGHESWHADAVVAALREHGAAACVSDKEKRPNPLWAATADWGYVRLFRPGYEDAELERCAQRIRDSGWQETFVFCKHELDGAGPELARRFRRIAGDADAPPPS
jgi:uncharacterized protein YecE (DUF72 family)